MKGEGRGMNREESRSASRFSALPSSFLPRPSSFALPKERLAVFSPCVTDPPPREELPPAHPPLQLAAGTLLPSPDRRGGHHQVEAASAQTGHVPADTGLQS